jgi:hypothetical protein
MCVCIYIYVSIELCLRNKNEFKSDSIKEALNALLEDEVPVLPLMRTAIRSAQALPADMRLFVLNEVLPRLMTKKVWDSSPRVWDGVVLAVKILVEMKEGEFAAKAFEPMMRAVLSAPPSKHFRTLLVTSPKLKSAIVVFLKGLLPSQREILLVGDASKNEDDHAIEAYRQDRLKILDISF